MGENSNGDQICDWSVKKPGTVQVHIALDFARVTLLRVTLELLKLEGLYQLACDLRIM